MFEPLNPPRSTRALPELGLVVGVTLVLVAGCSADTSGSSVVSPGSGFGTGGAVGQGMGNFSFFVTSLEVMRELSGSQDGFGGDFGGLAGADNICQQAAAKVGYGYKTWRAFLSATNDGSGNPVHAIDRIGQGPWYDRNGRLIANDIAGLINRGSGSGQGRPDGDPMAVDDLCNEYGEGLMAMGDTHDVLTGSNEAGQLYSSDLTSTCNDWTSTTVTPGGSSTNTSGGGGGRGGGGFGTRGSLSVGHAWPAQSGNNWIQAHTEASCVPGVNLTQNGAGDGSSVGAGGGWGAIYCFALTP